MFLACDHHSVCVKIAFRGDFFIIFLHLTFFWSTFKIWYKKAIVVHKNVEKTTKVVHKNVKKSKKSFIKM